jgi:hypothetical protein
VDDGWRLSGYVEAHRFMGQTERTRYRCEPDALWWPVAATAGADWTRACSTEETTDTTRGQIMGSEWLDVGATSVEATHVRFWVTLKGRTRGTGTIDAWLALGTALPLRLVMVNENRTGSTIGDVRYSERADLRLLSLEPRR